MAVALLGAHPLEKFEPTSTDTSIHRLSPKENLRKRALLGPVKVSFVTVVVTL